MSWTDQYWDAVDELYWSPQYIGLKSIPQKYWDIKGDLVTIPKNMTNPKGPLYRRLRSGEEFWEYVRRQEETFNHIFSLAFSILPGDVVCDIFSKIMPLIGSHNYQYIGLEIRSRYIWSEHQNITTPDAFFISEGSTLAVELKFNAKTSLDQLAKYVVILAAEEKLKSKSFNLDLLYIFNSDPVSAFTTQTGLNPKEVGGHHFDKLKDAVSNSSINLYLTENEALVRSVLDRINISCITWQSFTDTLLSFSNDLGVERGERVLKSLIDGLIMEISRHPLSNTNIPVREDLSSVHT